MFKNRGFLFTLILLIFIGSFTPVFAGTGSLNIADYPGAEKKYNNALVEIQKSLGKNPGQEQIARAIHDWICDHSVYATEEAEDPNYTGYAIYDPAALLVTGRGVCQAYTELFTMMARHFGLETQEVIGFVSKDPKGPIPKVLDDETTNHIWNIVKVDGTWYHVDVTWDDLDSEGVSKCYEYFLVGDKDNAGPSDVIRIWAKGNLPSMTKTYKTNRTPSYRNPALKTSAVLSTKAAFQEALKGQLMNRPGEILLKTTLSEKEALEAIDAMGYTTPFYGVLWDSMSYSFTAGSPSLFLCEPNYTLSEKEFSLGKKGYAAIGREIKKTLSPKAGDYEKIMALYRWFLKNVTVTPEDTFYNKKGKSFPTNIYTSVPLYGLGSYDSVNAAFLELAKLLGLKADYVYACKGEYADAWILVQINNRWYHVHPYYCIERKHSDGRDFFLTSDGEMRSMFPGYTWNAGLPKAPASYGK